MSIFTRTVDEAIDRFTLDDGTEVAVGYDPAADNPFNIGDTWKGMAIRRAGTGIQDWDGDADLGRAWDGWVDFEGSCLTAEEAEGWVGYTTECPGTYHQVKVTDLYGHPEFEVVISNEFWEIHGLDQSDELAQTNAQWLANEWGHWAEGQVYLIEVEHPDGETQYVGSIYEDITEENVRNYL